MPEPESAEEAALFHVNVYGAAEMYQINGMKEVALVHFKRYFSEAITCKKFARGIAVAYSVTVEQDRALRDFIVEQAVQNIDTLTETAQLDTALDETPPFGKELVHAVHVCHVT
ncbi:uncharacterized protein J3D65DRAFT_667548 [Phyllosticta citribraziliensis]|uniref:Uncharacterized protein n=1 Tax=Phyllosticta citribraziliensis TaxID=989973 RepID=A0ABR1LS62_9PEZI